MAFKIFVILAISMIFFALLMFLTVLKTYRTIKSEQHHKKKTRTKTCIKEDKL